MGGGYYLHGTVERIQLTLAWTAMDSNVGSTSYYGCVTLDHFSELLYSPLKNGDDSNSLWHSETAMILLIFSVTALW